MPGCGKCGRALEVIGNQIGRRDLCPDCGAELRACVHCRHYDESVAKHCKEPFAEVPSDAEAANFCEYFQIGEGGSRASGAREALLDAAEALFKRG